MRRLQLCAGLMAAVCGMCGTVGGQEDSGLRLRDLKRPVFRPEVAIPTARISGAKFYRDSDDVLWLFTAGEDKVVRRWRVSDPTHKSPAPHPQGTLELRLVGKVRWPLSYSVLGNIMALDVRTAGEGESVVAFGGEGSIPSQVNLFSADNPQEHGWGRRILVREQFAGDEPPVLSLSFHPQQPWLVAGLAGPLRNKDGSVLIWNVEESAPRAVQVATGLDDTAFVAFNPSGGHLAVADDLAGRVRTGRFRSQPEPGIELTTDIQVKPEHAPVQGFAWVDETTWAAGTTGGGVQFGNVNGGQKEAALPPPITTVSHVTSLAAFPGNGLLAVAGDGGGEGGAEGQGENRRNQASHVVLQTFRDRRRVALENAEFIDGVTATAFSPEGKYLAAIGRDSYGDGSGAVGNVIRLWSTESGRLLGQFPSATPPMQQSAAGGSAISAVAVTKSEPRDTAIAFRRGAQADFPVQHFQLYRPHPIDRQESAVPRRGYAAGGGRQVEFPSPVEVRPAYQGKGIVFSLQDDRGEMGPFPYIVELGAPHCARRFQKNGLRYVAVGYDYHIVVWDLQAVQALKDKQWSSEVIPLADLRETVVRGFTGHEARVTCLDVDSQAEANWLVSSSVDGSLHGWSLRGLGETGGEMGGVGELGLTLEQRGNRLVVRDSTPDGIAWLLGLEPGDEVRGVEIARVGRAKSDWPVPPGGWRSALEHPVPGLKLLISARDGETGEPFDVATTALQEPLWTLFPLRDQRNWVLWSPDGYFDATEQGLDVMGWNRNLIDQQNREVGLRFALARTFQDRFHSSLAFDRLFRSGQRRSEFLLTTDRMTEAGSIEFPSEVAITRITDSQGTAVTSRLEKPDDLRVALRVRRVGTEEIAGVQLWCNSRLIHRFDKPDPASASPLEAAIPKEFLRNRGGVMGGVGENTILAVVESRLGDGTTLVDTTTRGIFVAGGSDRKPKLHYLGVGVTRLEHGDAWAQAVGQSRSRFDLKHAANDAFFLGEALSRAARGAGSGFAAGRFRYLMDEASVTSSGERLDGGYAAPPTKELILAALDELAIPTAEGTPRADDLLVVLLAGHGFDELGIGNLFPGLSEEERSRGFYFLAQDAQIDLENTVSRDEVFSRLNRIPCRKLLLIDACHAGGFSPGDALKNLGGYLIGPQILVSCGEKQTSLEHGQARLDTGGQAIGQGIFTAAVIEALSGRRLAVAQGQPAMEPVAPQALDATGDSQVSIEELCLYVRDRVPALRDAVLTLDDRHDSGERPAGQGQVPQILSSSTLFAEKVELFRLAP